MRIDPIALKLAAKKLMKLRLTSVGDRKEHPCETLASVLKAGLGCLYEHEAVEYILESGLRYYFAAHPEGKETE